MVESLRPDINPNDRYCVAQYLAAQGRFILCYNHEQPEDNGAGDMGSRTLHKLEECGVSKPVLTQAICLFYRDNVALIDELRSSGDGQDYLSELERGI